jgi:hypothetical protein
MRQSPVIRHARRSLVGDDIEKGRLAQLFALTVKPKKRAPGGAP